MTLDPIKVLTQTGIREALPVNPVQLPDYIKKQLRNLSAEMNCVSIGRIATFYPETQTADIDLVFFRLLSQQPIVPGSQSAPLTDVPVQYPRLLSCPVVIMSGGAGGLTFPIATGDQCVVLFNDRDIDAWYQSGLTSVPNSNRLHDLSDGMAIVGLRPLTSSIEDYVTDEVVLFHGVAKVMLQDADHASLVLDANGVSVEDKIKIYVGAQTLRDAIDDLVTALTSATITGGAFSAGTITALNAAKTKLDAVLK